MTAADAGRLLVGLLVLAVPGGLLLFAAGVRDKLWYCGLAAPASIGVYVVAGVLSGIPGVSYGPVLVAVATVVLAAVAYGLGLLARRRQIPASEATSERPASWFPLLSPRLVLTAQVFGFLLCLGAIGLGLQAWHSGLGSFTTYPQEHDTIIHTAVTAYIADTGHGAPWQLEPLDLLTGTPVAYYPSGLLLTAALSGQLAGGPIVGFNDICAVCTAPAFILGCAALTAAVLRRLDAGRGWTALAGGVAAVVAAGLYRPGINMLHDGGIAPNAVAMSLSPGLLAAIITIGRRDWARALVLGLGVAAVFSVHPSSAITVGCSVVVFWVVEAFTRRGRRTLRAQWPVLLGAGVVAGLAAAGQILGSFSQAGRTGAWLPDIGPATLSDAVGSNLTLAYGGYIDPKEHVAQFTAAGAALLGVVMIVLTRRAWGALAMWAFWLLVSIDFKISPDRGPAASFVGSFFYKSYVRIQAHVSLFVPVLAAIGVLFAAVGLARLLAAPDRLVRTVPVLRATGIVAGVLLLVAMAGYVGTASRQYEHMNAAALASRYAKPEFVRVDDDDRRAADWLKGHIGPGERVMNSANDGSTCLYVLDRIPVVNIVTLGAVQIPYSYELLESFRDYPTDPHIRQEILSLDVTYVYVDGQAPVMGAGPGAPYQWTGTPTFALAPGLEGLDGLPGLTVAYRSGTVTVYRLDRSVLQEIRS